MEEHLQVAAELWEKYHKLRVELPRVEGELLRAIDAYAVAECAKRRAYEVRLATQKKVGDARRLISGVLYVEGYTYEEIGVRIGRIAEPAKALGREQARIYVNDAYHLWLRSTDAEYTSIDSLRSDMTARVFFLSRLKEL